MGLASNLMILFAAVAIATVAADTDIANAAVEATTIKEGDVFCPSVLHGTKCPDGSVFHNYKCCGYLNQDCCFNQQIWVIVVMVLMTVIAITGFGLSLACCMIMCCLRNNSR